jgi:hypothetical protein
MRGTRTRYRLRAVLSSAVEGIIQEALDLSKVEPGRCGKLLRLRERVCC